MKKKTKASFFLLVKNIKTNDRRGMENTDFPVFFLLLFVFFLPLAPSDMQSAAQRMTLADWCS